MNIPLLIINMKNYPEVLGKASFGLVKVAEQVAKEFDVEIVLAPPTPLLSSVAASTPIPVIVQHVDAEETGNTTGAVVIEVAKAAGAVGSLVNHSERRLPSWLVKRTVSRLKAAKMASIVCARTHVEVASYAKLRPNFVAIEPPELIGSGIAVSKAKPEVVVRSIKAAQKVNPEAKVICGAGIVAKGDVASALRLGTVGVLVSSGIVKASSWAHKIEELAGPLRAFGRV